MVERPAEGGAQGQLKLRPRAAEEGDIPECVGSCSAVSCDAESHVG